MATLLKTGRTGFKTNAGWKQFGDWSLLRALLLMETEGNETFKRW